MPRSFFPKPAETFVPGGAHLAVYLVPVFEESLVLFDVTAPEARGRWLPWDVLPFRGNPYEAAAALCDDWCDGAVSDLRLVDVISGASATGSWEFAIVFRASLVALPTGDRDRHPDKLPAGEVEAVGPFAAVDLQRWLASTPPGDLPTPGSPRLIF